MDLGPSSSELRGRNPGLLISTIAASRLATRTWAQHRDEAQAERTARENNDRALWRLGEARQAYRALIRAAAEVVEREILDLDASDPDGEMAFLLAGVPTGEESWEARYQLSEKVWRTFDDLLLIASPGVQAAADELGRLVHQIRNGHSFEPEDSLYLKLWTAQERLVMECRLDLGQDPDISIGALRNLSLRAGPSEPDVRPASTDIPPQSG